MIRALRCRDVPVPEAVVDPERVRSYLEDASGRPAGNSTGVVRPSSEAEAAAFLRNSLSESTPVLFQAGRSSLTGGAIPRGELVLSVERLDRIGPLRTEAGGARIEVDAGVRLDRLQSHLARRGYYYPPVPTYAQAMIGGTVATNAGGAATFKYGATRRWIRGLRVVLFNGDVLVLDRGRFLAGPGESFEIGLSDGGVLRVPAPQHRLPALPKISAGYFAADPLDLVDLFVGSEGTLGLIVSVTLDLVPLPPAVLTGFVHVDDPAAALDLAGAMRAAAEQAREERDPAGPDVRSIEWFDGKSLGLLKDAGIDRRLRVEIPQSAGAAVFFELELADRTSDAEVQELIEGFFARRGDLPDVASIRLFDILDRHGGLEGLELGFPEDDRRRRAMFELRHAVPVRVSERIAEIRRSEPGVAKVGGDLIVPFERLGEMIDLYAEGFSRRGLDYAIWGHLGDGNLHPNAIPRCAAEMRPAREAMIEFAEEAIRRGGCPLSEHGVGRNGLKQELLRLFVGDAAIARMRAVKAALDPTGRLAPGVLFPAISD